jgi:hypothetical protein
MFKFNKETNIETPYSQYVKNAKNIREAFYCKLNTKGEDINKYDSFHTTTKCRIAFLDCVLDFKEQKFYLWEEINFPYFSTVQMKPNYYQYFQNPNRETIEKIKEKIYKMSFGDKVKTALHFFSRALAGNMEDKNWAYYLGNRNCGKGVIYDSLAYGFETYVQTFELSMIQYQRQTNSDETSRKLYWLMDLEFTRLAILQEIPDIHQNMQTCGKTLKGKLASGGDNIRARRNYDRKDTIFKIDATFMMMGNNELFVDTPDAFETCVEFSSVIEFKTQEEIDEMIADKEDQLVIDSFKIRDDTTKDNCKTEEWQNAIVYLIFENYKKYAVSVYKNADDGDNYNLRKSILKNFTITGNSKNYLLCEEVHAALGDCKKKICNEFKSMGVMKKKNKNVGNDRDKFCYYGIVKREAIEEDED